MYKDLRVQLVCLENLVPLDQMDHQEIVEQEVIPDHKVSLEDMEVLVLKAPKETREKVEIEDFVAILDLL